MEPDHISAPVSGLAVLSAIPVVLFALWADYFGRHLEELSTEDPDYNRGAELFRVRLAGLAALLFQVTLFFGAGDARKDHPILLNVIFMAAILIQGGIQVGVERKITADGSKPVDQLKIALRAFFFATLGGLGYLAIMILSVQAFAFLADILHSTKTVTSIMVISGAILGIVGGLILNFALMPLHFRKALLTAPLEDQGLLEMFQDSFKKAGLASPGFWVITFEHLRSGTAFMAGFKGGRWIFKPGLFISAAVLKELDRDELKAVLLHEISHLSLNHLRKRVLLASCLVTGIIVTAMSVTLLANWALKMTGNTGAQGLIGPIAAFLSVFVTFRGLSRQSKRHEIEADIHSIEKLGGNLESLGSALRKLDRLNDHPATPIGLGGYSHPATELRIKLLQLYFGKGSSEKDRTDQAA